MPTHRGFGTGGRMSKQVRCVMCEYLSLFEDDWICTALGDDMFVPANEDIYEWHDDCPYWADEEDE